MRKAAYCAVEWNEPKNPRNVVLSKRVSGLDGKAYEVGQPCRVQVKEGSKVVMYDAEVLGEGKKHMVAKRWIKWDLSIVPTVGNKLFVMGVRDVFSVV